MNIQLGFEVSDDTRKSGRPVSVPLKHTAVLGQTQESGKTTTQEAMIMRSGLRAIAFITKRGEKSFRLMKTIPIYFKEATGGDYWKYVVSIVEGMLEIRLGWQEQAWITKLCRHYNQEGKTKTKSYSWQEAKSFRDLLTNVQIAMPHMRGTAELICMRIEENLKSVIGEIEHSKFADTLTLHPGINVMDISRLSPTLQALVIRSAIEWIHKKERGTIVIIPEAWKFIPQGRQTPVKPVAERLIREGAVLRNFVWIDSQDLRGVEKNILRSVGLWLFGVQREKNEVANTLDSIPDSPKPSATDIMRLGRGQFYVAFGNQCVRTYVQPAGMLEDHAQAIARGEESPDSWKQIVRSLDEQEKEEEKSAIRQAGDGRDIASDSWIAAGDERDDRSIGESSADDVAASTIADSTDQESEDEKMWKERAETAEAEIVQLKNRIYSLEEKIRLLVSEKVDGPGLYPNVIIEQQTTSKATQNDQPDLEKIWYYVRDQAIKTRSQMLAVLVEQPELQISTKRKTIQVDGNNLQGRLAGLIAQKFFDNGRTLEEIRAECLRRGWFGSKTPNAIFHREDALEGLVALGFLTKENGGYKAVPGMKINIIETK